MDVRTVICSHSSQVTHADIRLVSSHTVAINLNIEVGNTSLVSYIHLSVQKFTLEFQKFIFFT